MEEKTIENFIEMIKNQIKDIEKDISHENSNDEELVVELPEDEDNPEFDKKIIINSNNMKVGQKIIISIKNNSGRVDVDFSSREQIILTKM